MNLVAAEWRDYPFCNYPFKDFPKKKCTTSVKINVQEVENSLRGDKTQMILTLGTNVVMEISLSKDISPSKNLQ